MPIQKYAEQYECEYCGKVYDTVDKATDCEIGHDVVYLPISKHDLRRLWSFIVTGQPDYLTPSIERTLRKYNKIVGRK